MKFSFFRLGAPLAFAWIALGCSETRPPISGGPSGNKDATPGQNDGGPGNEDARTQNTNMDASSRDATTNCTCNVTINACDPGCACDPLCTSRDGGIGADYGFLQGDSFDANAKARAMAAALCGYLVRCDPARVSSGGMTQSSCENEYAQYYATRWPANSAAIAEGRVAFRQSVFDQCTRAFQNADCVLGVDPNACLGMFEGSRPVGAPCYLGSECVGDTYCTAGFNQCGACAPAKGRGDDCQNALCGRGLSCYTVDQQGTTKCLEDDIAENQSCADVTNGLGLCRGRLDCVGQQAPGRCTRPPGPGQTCDPNLATAADCNIFANSVCVEGTSGSTCQTLGWAEAGQTCNAQTACKSGTYCDVPQSATSGTCANLPGVGQTCYVSGQSELCARGAYCANRTCATLPGQGQSCQSECADEYLCLGGTCQSLNFVSCN